jgi:hypothetical protein
MVISILLLSLLISPITANPLPSSEIDVATNPVPDSDTPLFLKSENITFRITNNVTASGNFTIYNPSNGTFNQTILFPFYRSWQIDEMPGIYHYKILNLTVNDTGLEYGETEWGVYPAIFFNISVSPLTDQIVHIKFRTHYASEHLYEEYRYITKTAKEWPRPIEYAYFEFIFDNATVGGNLIGGDEVHRNGSYWVTTIERFNWTPEENIEISWNTPAYYSYHSTPRVYLSHPFNEVIFDEYEIFFSWQLIFINEDNDTVFYDFYLSTNESAVSNHKQSALAAGNLTGKDFSTCVYQDNTKYFWTVKPHTNNKTGSCENGVWAFKPDCWCIFEPVLKSPANKLVLNSTTATLIWSEPAKCLKYDVYMSTDFDDVQNLDPSALVSEKQISTNITINDLQDSKTYYWTAVVTTFHIPLNETRIFSFTTSIDTDGDGVRDSGDDFPDDAEGSDSSVSGAASFNWLIIIIAIIIAVIILINYTLFLMKKVSK